MNDYKDEIIDHYKHPRNFGEMSSADLTNTEANTSCGDMMRIYLKMDGDKVTEMKWQGVGCAISTAAASMLSEKIVGMKLAEIEAMGETGVVEMMGGEINPGRMKCANLAYRALINTLNKQ